MSLAQSSIHKPELVQTDKLTRRLSLKATLLAKNKWRRLSRFFKLKRTEVQNEDDAEHNRTGCIGEDTSDRRSARVDNVNFDIVPHPPMSPTDSTSGIWRGISRRRRVRVSGADFDMVSTTSTSSCQAGGVYRSHDRSVRVEGIDFDIVSIPSSTRSAWPETPQNEALGIRSDTPTSLEFEDYSAYYAMPSPLRHRFSTQSVIDDCCNYASCDSLERQALRRRLSLQTQFRQFEQTWATRSGPLVRPGSIYEQMMEIDREITDLMKERIFYLNPGGPFISRQTFNSEFMELLETTTREQSTAEPSPHRIKRKPVPAS